MSFTDEIKEEVLSVWQKRPCCRYSETCGMVLFLQQDDKIVYKTKDYHSARHLRKLLKKTADIDVEPIQIGAKYVIEFEKNKLDFPDEINSDIFKCDGCIAAFLRGVFLVSGSCSNPEKEYDLTFTFGDEKLSYQLCRLLENCGFAANTRDKKLKSGVKYIVYIKKSRCIEDFLTLIGAQNSTLKLMQYKVIKDVRNSVNRKTNFEAANIIKSSASAAVQLEAINKINVKCGINMLPDELRELAQIRLDNPDLSLTEIGKICGLSRSGVHHRLQKIIKFSEDLK